MLRSAGETLALNEQFDFAFSVNVMEHVDDVGQVLRRVHRALKPGGLTGSSAPTTPFPMNRISTFRPCSAAR